MAENNQNDPSAVPAATEIDADVGNTDITQQTAKSHGGGGGGGGGESTRARARWTILRKALLSKYKQERKQEQIQQQEQKGSIHEFPGFELIKRQENINFSTLQNDNDDYFYFIQALQKVSFVGNDDYNDLSAAMHALILVASTQNNKNSNKLQIHCENMQQKQAVLHFLRNGSTFIHESFLFSIQNDENDAHKNNGDNELNTHNVICLTDIKRFKIYQKYTIGVYQLSDLHCIITREPKAISLTLQDLISHRESGLDNTGQICVWDSERTMAHWLYNNTRNFDWLSNVTSVIELGAGMAGLAAIALAMKLCHSQQSSINVTLTDGHVDGVYNNQVNWKLTKAYHQQKMNIDNDNNTLLDDKISIHVQVLLWSCEFNDDSDDNNDDGTQSQQQQQQQRQQQRRRQHHHDLCLVSDCLHFQHYHAALLCTIAKSIKLHGKVLLCQPTRCDSMTNFLKMLHAANSLFDVQTLPIKEWIQHHTPNYQDLIQHASFQPDRHCPELLLLTKCREFTKADCNQWIELQNEYDKHHER